MVFGGLSKHNIGGNSKRWELSPDGQILTPHC